VVWFGWLRVGKYKVHMESIILQVGKKSLE
jgi:hypothetical protein